ncbi:MAG: FAD-dependent 5-carboxymethylaminomethyl-2-thiouridine(34) oxidoreductase MnmC, partial [Halioglobus sp.]
RVTKPNTALVIGAGLAGATTAAALANRGIEVTVIDAGSIADGASANPQGVLYTRLSTRHSNLVDFALQSYLFATQFYANCFARGALISPEDGQLCGCFAQINKAEELKTLADRLHSVPHLASVLSASQASDELGAEVTRSGYWYPRSGWLSPASVCRALLDNPSIEVFENVGPVRLDSIEGLWRASAAGKSIKTAAIAILATGTATNTFDCLRWLPLQPVRGQTTQLPVTEQSLTLKAVLCHEGYIAPTAGKSHCIGASFGPGDTEDAERVTEHQDNIRALQNAIPSWSSSLGGLESDTLSGKVRFRCASNDYLPVVGQVPDYDAFCSTYASLRKDAGKRIAQSGNYLTGLYVNTAHGSRGLTSTPLAAEWLASEICNEPRPYSRKLSRALSPARFIIRGLNRNRI